MPDARSLRPLQRLIIGAGLGWAAAFVAIGVAADLQTWGDGSIFAYAVAVRDAWAFHWHNISGRLFTYGAVHVPAEATVALTGSARAGIAVYGALFFAAPLAGLLITAAVDRSRGRAIFTAACLSTALFCPLVFGCPTEMWMAHAVFWPALAVCREAPPTRLGAAAVFAVLFALVFTHEGAVVLALVLLIALALPDLRARRVTRAIVALVAAMAIWAAVKLTIRPDDYIAEVLAAAAFHFIEPGNLADPAVLEMAAALALYAAVATALSRACRAPTAAVVAGAFTAGALAAWWLGFDRTLLAGNRYPLRTALLIGPPLIVGATSLARADTSRLPPGLAPVGRLIERLRRPSLAPFLVGGFALVMLAHAVETAKFVRDWRAYRAAVQALATGDTADPALGDSAFVSAQRIDADLNRLSWNSTTPYLSVLAAPGLSPRRLVVDPTANYFWLSCATATRSAAADVPVPVEAREKIRRLACLHR